MNSITEHKIFTPFTIGRVSLRHRVVMAPLTRLRSEQPRDVPGPLIDILVYTRNGPLPAPRSRALQTQELPEFVDLYGVEVLAAGGYLLDQFLQNGTNLRADVFDYVAGALNRKGYIDYATHTDLTNPSL